MIGTTETKASSSNNGFTMNQNYIFPTIIVLFILYKILKSIKNKKLIPRLINEGAVIVDVRSEAEFKQGSNPISINVPLDQLSKRLSELDKSKMIILCCASGMRSGTALAMLKTKGFTHLYNAGSWTSTIQ